MRHPTPTGQWFTSSDGQKWWFDSGAASLDFAYTGGFDERWESLHTAENLAEWLGGRFPEFDGQASDGNLRDARGLRASLARMTVAASHGHPLAVEDVDIVNLVASMPDIPPPALVGGSRRAGRSSATCGQALASMAREAIELFAPDQHNRLRECAADDCALMFYDESRSNNRRWCSMQRCGNRAKVRAHRSRAAER